MIKEEIKFLISQKSEILKIIVNLGISIACFAGAIYLAI